METSRPSFQARPPAHHPKTRRPDTLYIVRYHRFIPMDAHQLELVQQRAKNLSNLYGKPPELFLDVAVTMEFDEAMDRLDEIDAFLSPQAEPRTKPAANAPGAARLLGWDREA